MYYSLVLSKKDQAYKSEYLGEEIIDFLGNTFNIPNDFDAEVVDLESGYEGRSDLISDEAYMDEMYFDVICKLNGFSNPFEVNATSALAFPTGPDLYRFAQNPSDLWKESGDKEKTVKPRAKARNEKRKPNEAVIGDKRFNINGASKIVVY